jgi:hypothetical protein
LLQLAAPFDEYVAVAVDKNVGYGGIPYERLERAEAERLMLDFKNDLIALPTTKRCLLFREQVFHRFSNLLLNQVPRQNIDFGKVDPLDQMAMDARL